jgi:hypothetical protein
MPSFEEIPNLTSISREYNTGDSLNTTHKSAQVPNISSTSPSHLEYDLRGSIDMGLYKRAGLMCLPNFCLPEVTKHGKTVTSPTEGSAEFSILVYGTRSIYLLPRARLLDLFICEIG